MSDEKKYDCASCDHKKRNTDPSAHCYMFKAMVTKEGDCMQHSNLPKPSKTMIKFGMAAAVIGIMTDTEINYTPSI